METANLFTVVLKTMGDIFIPAPFIAALPAVIFFVGYKKTQRIFVLVTAILWAIYLLYESAAKLRLICSGECNIRVDLLLMYPLLLIMSSAAVVLMLKGRPATAASATQEKPSRLRMLLITLASLVCIFFLLGATVQVVSLYNLLPFSRLYLFLLPAFFYGISLAAFSYGNTRPISIIAAVAGVILLIRGGISFVSMFQTGSLGHVPPLLFGGVAPVVFVLAVLWPQIKPKKEQESAIAN